MSTLQPPRLRLAGARGWVLAALFASQAWAGDGNPAARAPLLPKYRAECAACHIAYPPGMLPAASWQHLMANLPRHYGTDASLDPGTVSELANWLAAGAATSGRRSEPPPDDRITRSAWFVRKHHEVAPATWKPAKRPERRQLRRLSRPGRSRRFQRTRCPHPPLNAPRPSRGPAGASVAVTTHGQLAFSPRSGSSAC